MANDVRICSIQYHHDVSHASMKRLHRMCAMRPAAATHTYFYRFDSFTLYVLMTTANAICRENQKKIEDFINSIRSRKFTMYENAAMRCCRGTSPQYMESFFLRLVIKGLTPSAGFQFRLICTFCDACCFTCAACVLAFGH